MMAAAQPFISGAISKTVNMPKDTTPEDVGNAYLEGWKLGLKALAVYRDGSKGAQPLSTKQDTETKQPVSAPRRERLPDTRQSVTHKFSIAGHEGYITVGLYPDGRPGEMFITMAKEGSTIGGLMDCFGTAVSMSWQYGVPLEVYVNKFSHTRFEPMGHTKNPDIRIAKSIVDYIFRWLGITFLPGYLEFNAALANGPADLSKTEPGELDAELRPAAKKAGGPNAGPGLAATTSKTPPGGTTNGHTNGTTKRAGASASGGTAVLERGKLAVQAEASVANLSEQFAKFQTDAPSCDNCGAITVRNGNCYLCHVCGNSMGCS
jgi:ribonucleoside-diphosphate reductase alpha chain